MRFISFLTVLLSLMCAASAEAQTASDRPWLLPDPILILDPYQDNVIDFDKVASDRAVKAMIHRAYFELTADTRYVSRVAEAKRRGLLTGLYLLGRPGDPIKQADALIAAGSATGVKLLALDIENLDPSRSMTLKNAVRFIERVHDKTGRYPLFYTNFSTYKVVSTSYGPDSVFAKTPLWIARFRNSHGMSNFRVWSDYTVWQFQSELNCKVGQTCLRRVPGTASDMDVNIYRGTEEDLKQLFEPQ